MEWLAPAPLSLSLLHFPFLLSNSFPPVSSLSGSTPPSPPFSLSRLSFSTGELVSRACHASTEVKTVRFSFSRPFPRHFFFNGGRLILEEAKRRERPVGRVWARARRVMSPRPAKILVASFLALSPRTLAKERDPRNR